jgi:hypothetical protein
MKFQLLASVAASQLVAAHFGLLYPEWRGDTLAEDTEFDQWMYPCKLAAPLLRIVHPLRPHPARTNTTSYQAPTCPLRTAPSRTGPSREA